MAESGIWPIVAVALTLAVLVATSVLAIHSISHLALGAKADDFYGTAVIAAVSVFAVHDIPVNDKLAWFFVPFVIFIGLVSHWLSVRFHLRLRQRLAQRSN